MELILNTLISVFSHLWEVDVDDVNVTFKKSDKGVWTVTIANDDEFQEEATGATPEAAMHAAAEAGKKQLRDKVDEITEEIDERRRISNEYLVHVEGANKVLTILDKYKTTELPVPAKSEAGAA